MIRILQRLLALGALLGAQPILAHDVWIEPSSFAAGQGQTIGLRLRVGQDLQGEPLALVPGLASRFVIQDASGRKPIAQRLRSETAGQLQAATGGLQIVGYYSNPSFIELPAEKFSAYLIEEGLDAVIAQRAQRGQSRTSAREIYSRCAKTLLLAGLPSESQRDASLGFPLELVAERNPYRLGVGEQLPVRLTYQDRPLAGALVVAHNSLNPKLKQSARTDRDGRVRLQVGPGGMWLIKAVHMVPAPAGVQADWASYWASLTFDSSVVGDQR